MRDGILSRCPGPLPPCPVASCHPAGAAARVPGADADLRRGRRAHAARRRDPGPHVRRGRPGLGGGHHRDRDQRARGAGGSSTDGVAPGGACPRSSSRRCAGPSRRSPVLAAARARRARRPVRHPDVLDHPAGRHRRRPRGRPAHRDLARLRGGGAVLHDRAGRRGLGRHAWPTPWVLFTIEMLGVAAGRPAVVRQPGASDEAGRALLDDESALPPASCEAGGPGSGPFHRHLPRRCRGHGGAGRFATSPIVAALREFQAQSPTGWVLRSGAWARSSGAWSTAALHRSISAFWLLGGLGLVTAPMALAAPARRRWPRPLVRRGSAGARPRLTATIDQVSRVVPSTARGEAMGWHGSFMTAGMALARRCPGVAIDRWGWSAGFALVAVVGPWSRWPPPVPAPAVCAVTAGTAGLGAGRGRRLRLRPAPEAAPAPEACA